LALQALVAPIYWCCEHRSTNILVLPAHVAPIYWCYDVRSTNILVLRVLAAPISAHTGLFTTWWSVQFLADFFTIINYRTPCFLYGDHPTPSPVTGRDQWEFRGGGAFFIYTLGFGSTPTPSPVSKSANNNCKRNGAANRKIFKKEKCRKYLQHHALSFKLCLFNLL
jgi:hypothetical protein